MGNSGKRQTMLLGITALIYVVFGLLTSVIGVAIDRFQAQYGVSLGVAALLPLAFFLAYGLTSIPFGLLTDRFGAKSVLLLGTALMGTGSALCYLSAAAWAVIVSVFLIGTGVTAVQIAGNPFVRELDQPSRYTSNLTLIIGIGALGYALSPLIVPVLQANNLSWTTIYLLLAVVNAVIFVVVAFAHFPKTTTNADERLNLGRLFHLCRNPLVLVYALGIFL